MMSKLKIFWDDEKLLWKEEKKLTNRDNIIGLILYVIFWVFMFLSQHYQSALIGYCNSFFSLKTAAIIVVSFRAIVLALLFMESGLRLKTKNQK